MTNSDRSPGNTREEGTVCWRSPSNIALVKYWGKRAGQLPANPSVSITLNNSFTCTCLKYRSSDQGKGRLLNFSFGGEKNEAFAGRVSSFLNSLGELYPFIGDYDLEVTSRNSFPHSSGIASSASAMSALALCLTSMERIVSGSPSEEESFFRKASYVARMGSGSAARSVYPGYVLWGRFPGIPWSADEFAVPLNDNIHKEFREMGDAILLVDDTPKRVSSSRGHALMEGNPWSAVRYEQASRNTSGLIDVLAAGDLDEFVRITEQEALTLHSLMMNSDEGYILMKPGTLEVIERVRRFREETGVPAAFTLDAGPNVHLIYPVRFRESVIKLIDEELLQFCPGRRWIDDAAGGGPLQVDVGAGGDQVQVDVESAK